MIVRLIRDSSGKFPILIMIVLAVLVCGGVGVLMLKKGAKKPKGQAVKAQEVELSDWKLDEFIVNLADREEPRYLKVSVTLEVEGAEPKGGGHGEGAARPEEARARDAIISTLTRKHYAELLSEEGKTRLKAELKKELNSVLHDCKVANIYFTSFAMQ